METQVLIPDEMSLVLTLHPNPRNVLEMNVALWSNTTLPAGTCFYPDSGSPRLDRLEVYSTLPENDVRNSFGCEDSISEIDGRQVRRCNWIRFLKTSDVIGDVNVLGMKVKDEIMFQTTNTILPNEEIVAYLKTDIEPAQQLPELVPESQRSITPDLPKVKIEVHDTTQSPRQLQVARDLLTSPPSRDDDCKSSVSDSTSSELPSPKPMSTPETERYSDTDLHPGHMSNYPQQMSPLNLSSPRTPSSNSTSSSSMFTSPTTSTIPPSSSPLSSPQEHPSMSMRRFEQTPSPPDMTQRPKRNRERTWLPCDVCGKKFDRPSLLKRHIRTHTGEKPHACDVCGKAFSTSSSLNTHRRIHSGEKPHQCGVCGKRFTASSNLYYHRMTHNKEKPHKCQLCSKSFPTPGDLKSHMYVHNGSWPYRCDVCNRGFSKQTNLKNHLLLHTGDKPHECNVCQKKFALFCNLKTHMKTHEEDNQGRCVTCGRTFLKKDASDVCIDCTRAASPTSPPTNKRPVSDFSISKLTNRDDQSHCVTSPTAGDVRLYDPRLFSLYNPAIFLTPPSAHVMPADTVPFRFMTNYGEFASTHAPGLLVPGSPAASIADIGYHSRAAMAALSSSWSGLMAK